MRRLRDIDGAMILMKSKVLAVTILTALSATIDPALAQVVQCGRMQADLAQLQDGALFYRPHLAPATVGWTQLTAGPPPVEGAQPTKMDFIYVARENWLPEGRPGMVVIKSCRTRGTEPAPPGPEMVGLRRIEPADSYPNPGCGKKYVFKSYSYKKSVLGESYDRYHDSGARIPLADQAIIEGMHSAYVGRNAQCKQSNETVGDTFAGRSNRGQFSFSDSVVVAQFKSQVFAAFRVSPSYAGTFSNRAVEVRRYQTNPNRIACVAFTLTVAQPNFFLRINDLERVKGSELSPQRGDESQWNLTR